MDFKMLKPLHGWRAFFGEVGVVVLGVVLALAAQQVAEEVQNQADERAFRETIDHEMGLNLFFYEVRARQFACDAKHVEELRAWLDRARSGESVPPIHREAPNIITPYRSAWDTRDTEVFNHLPANVRQKYAEFYDELANNWAIMKNEDDDWSRLTPYVEPGVITLADRRAIRPIIGSIRGWNELLQANIPISRKIADTLGVKPVRPDNLPDDWLAHLADCPSVIGPRR